MIYFVLIAGIVLLYGAVSGRFERTIITGPMVFTASGCQLDGGVQPVAMFTMFGSTGVGCNP